MSVKTNILRLSAVIAMTGLSRSTIYSLVNRGEFPQRVYLSPRAMGFLESEVDAWVNERVAASRIGG